MKTLFALLLALTMVFGLCACDSQPAGPTEGTAAPTDAPTQAPTDAPTEAPTEAPKDDLVYSFTFEGVELVPGNAFDATQLSEADSVYQVPSCAIDGMDNVYNYGKLEVTAYNDGTSEIIYSIYILDPNTSTNEGLYLGDNGARVSELYGDDFTEDGSARVYTRGATTLIVILSNDSVTGIEYRWVS